jgi:hypothetical protein
MGREGYVERIDSTVSSSPQTRHRSVADVTTSWVEMVVISVARSVCARRDRSARHRSQVGRPRIKLVTTWMGRVIGGAV